MGNPDLEKVKKIFTRGLVSLDILEVQEIPDSVEAAENIIDENVKYRTYIIDDCTKPYLIRLGYTDNKKVIHTVDPDFLDEGDKFEVSESIQDILRENDFPVIKSNFPTADEPVQEPQEPIKQPKIRQVLSKKTPVINVPKKG